VLNLREERICGFLLEGKRSRCYKLPMEVREKGIEVEENFLFLLGGKKASLNFIVILPQLPRFLCF
jgi:hypothetical protein